MDRRLVPASLVSLIPLLVALAPAQIQSSTVGSLPTSSSLPQRVRTVEGPAGNAIVQVAASDGEVVIQGSTQGRSASRGLGSFLPLGQGVEGDQPEDVVLALDGMVAVAALRDTDSLEFYDVRTGARLGGATLPDAPLDLDVTPDGTRVFAACYGADVVAVVDVASRSVLHTVAVANQPHQVAILSDGVRAVVGCNVTLGGGLLQLIDGQTGQQLARQRHPRSSPWRRPSVHGWAFADRSSQS